MVRIRLIESRVKGFLRKIVDEFARSLDLETATTRSTKEVNQWRSIDEPAGDNVSEMTGILAR